MAAMSASDADAAKCNNLFRIFFLHYFHWQCAEIRMFASKERQIHITDSNHLYFSYVVQSNAGNHVMRGSNTETDTATQQPSCRAWVWFWVLGSPKRCSGDGESVAAGPP